MAAPDMVVSNLGQADGAGALDALWLKLYAGEVLTAFETVCVAKGRHIERTIQHGKSSQLV